MKKITLLLSLLLTISFFAHGATYTIDFENEKKTAYASADVNLGGVDSIKWNLTDAIIAKTSMANADYIVGTGSLRLRGYATTSATMLANKAGGIGTISFTYKQYGNDGQSPVKIDWSSDGSTWTNIGEITADNTEKTFTYSLNQSNARIRFTSAATTSSNKRMNIDNIVMTDNGGAPISAMPTITPATSDIYGPTTVTITSQNGGVIYYSMDGSNPTNASTQYTAPFTVTGNTTVKAISYESGKDPSPISTATYTLKTATSVSNIAALRSITLPSTESYKLTGEAILTLKSATRNAKYIQDASGAILIDDPSGVIKTTYNVGDGITGIIGTLATYNGMLQFTPVANPPAATSTGNTVTPKVITLAEMVNHQAELVTIKNVTLTDIVGGTGVFQASKNYPIVGTTTEVLRTAYADLDYIGQTIPTTPKNITGVVLTYSSTTGTPPVTTTTQQLVPRSLADFVTTGLFSSKNESLKLWVNKNKINFNAVQNENVEVYNASGQKIASQKAVDGDNSIEIANKGVTIVKVGNRIGKVIL